VIFCSGNRWNQDKEYGYQDNNDGIRWYQEKALAKYNLYSSNFKIMSSNDYTERQRQVLELYTEGKTTRETAKILRMSLRDINVILKNHGLNHGIAIIKDNDKDNNQSHSNQKSTQAYKLFSEGYKPVEVAIQLGLSEKQVTKYCREYWELQGLHELTFLYEERKHHLPSFLRLHNVMERQGIDNEKDIANVLKYANELPNLQQYWENLRDNNHNLKRQNQELEKDLHARKREIVELTEVENMHHQNIDTLQNDIDHLLNERRQLQQYVSRFKNGDGKYLKIKDVAAEQVHRLLTEEESLLDLALKAVIEALRMNSDRYNVIYNSKYDNNDNIFDSSNGTAIPTSYQNYYYNKYHEGLIELAKGFLNLLSSQLVDNTMVAAVKENDGYNNSGDSKCHNPCFWSNLRYARR
jgi:DNA-binding CsgD family transcriptional regulator